MQRNEFIRSLFRAYRSKSDATFSDTEKFGWALKIGDDAPTSTVQMGTDIEAVLGTTRNHVNILRLISGVTFFVVVVVCWLWLGF